MLLVFIYKTSLILHCIKGFTYRFSQDNHLEIDREVLTAYCRSSSGNYSVDFRTICTSGIV